jgi:hypothetical protein
LKLFEFKALTFFFNNHNFKFFLFVGQHFTTEAEQLFVEIKEFLLESSDPAEESHNKQVLENFKTENQFGITCLQF